MVYVGVERLRSLKRALTGSNCCDCTICSQMECCVGLHCVLSDPIQDSWEAVRVGDEVILRGLKPCGRCKLTRVHKEQGYVTGEEPIRTLKE